MKSENVPPSKSERNDGSFTFEVHVVPGSSGNRVAGLRGTAIKVNIAAAAVRGAANKALVKFLSRKLGVRKSQIEIVSGLTSRDKMLRVWGLDPDELRSRLLSEES